MRAPTVEDLPRLRGGLRILRERQWVLAALGVVVLSWVFVLLGEWQWHRHVAKSDAAAQERARYHAAPEPLGQALPTVDSPLPADLVWQSVRLTGSYLADRTVLVRNRPVESQYGYEVLVPLRTAAGVFVVDRGWVAEGRTAAGPDSVPPPPSGPVEVVARLRPGEPHDTRTPPAGQLYSIDLPVIGADLGEPVFRAYGVLASESPAPAQAPLPLPEPENDLGPHLSYAVQWVGFAITAYVVLLVAAVREHDRRETAEAIARGEPVPVRSGRVEPEDEEW